MAKNIAIILANELTSREKLKVAKEHFSHWYKAALEFWGYFEVGIEREQYKSASFLLHQAAESSYKALLLVYTNYSSYDHYLDSMNRQALEILPAMEDIFPCETKADKDLFKLFDYAYIGARYDPDFDITQKELEYLSGRVELLLGLTDKLCKERIEKLKQDCIKK